MELAEEIDLKAKADLRFMRDRLEEAQADARVWRNNYQRTIVIASIFSPPALLEILEDTTYREFEEAARRL